jgi:NhaP-type Na+/H+ or K+/H+ antiporter
MNFELKKIDVFSAIKISFFINLILGLLIGLFIGFFMAFFISMFNQFNEVNQFGGGFNPAAFGIFGGFFLGFVYAIFIAVINGVVLTGLFVLLYNLFAGWLGGIKVHFAEIPSGVKAQPIMTQASATAPPPPDTTGGTV